MFRKMVTWEWKKLCLLSGLKEPIHQCLSSIIKEGYCGQCSEGQTQEREICRVRKKISTKEDISSNKRSPKDPAIECSNYDLVKKKKEQFSS